MLSHGSSRSSLDAVFSAQPHHGDGDDPASGSGNLFPQGAPLSSRDADADVDIDGGPRKRRGTSEAASIGSVTPLPSSIRSASPQSLSVMTVDMDIVDSDPTELIPIPAPPIPSSSQHRVRAAHSLPNMHTTTASGSSGAGSDSGEANHPNNNRNYSRPTPRHHTTSDVDAHWVRDPPTRPRRTASPVAIRAAIEAPPPPTLNILQQIGRIFTNDGREQRKRAGILARLAFNLAQIVIITIFLALSASIWKSKDPEDLDITEWKACDRPLGIWNALWAARITLGLLLGIWEWRRQQDRTRRTESRNRDAEESLRGAGVPAGSGLRSQNQQPAARHNQRTTTQQRMASLPEPSSATTRPSISEAPAAVASMMVNQISPGSASIPHPPTASRNEARGAGSLTRAPAQGDGRARTERERRERDRRRQGGTGTQTAAAAATVTTTTPNTPSNTMFDRFETCLTILALAHFVGNNILLFSSVHTCRFSSPHIWWLGLTIACLGYVVVVEVILIAIVIFVLGPILLLTLNLLMLCLGRQYDRGNPTIRAEIPKLDQKWVDQIPLVVYIPPKSEGVNDDDEVDETETPIPVHTYPPKAPEAPAFAAVEKSQPIASSSTSPITATNPDSVSKRSGKGRLLFLRRKAEPPSSVAGDDDAPAASTSADPPTIGAAKSSPHKPLNPPTSSPQKGAAPQVVDEDPWEARFERGEHPFVTLDGNRAACAICLCDFIEPKRRGAVSGDPAAPAEGDQEKAKSPSPSAPVEPEREDEASVGKKKKMKRSKPKPVKDTIDEEQAGIPGEPLRLLACGHVFHRTCLDPWLLDVSGRCPVCQTAVDMDGEDDEHH
ncbi:hypothetical protein FRB96_005489 [Tulasnella sp. 330]|nr:hypothetical protein FRB96_005489 [Tulasnella sp. 330]